MTGSVVLDHGYVHLIESWGSDERIIEAARMSTSKGFQGWGPISCPQCSAESQPGTVHTPDGGLTQCPKCKGEETIAGDEKLLAYLYRHKHMTPFEMAGMIIEVQAPIFVFREWHRHRTQSYNELSARYTPLPDVNYIPTVERVLQRDIKNKQAMAVGDQIDAAKAALFIQQLSRAYHAVQLAYQSALDYGVPKELARLPVPVARYSKMRASANLRNWLQFLTLRMDNNAQWEIRQYANVVGSIIEGLFPRTWELFIES